jgi:hypothetical protein
MKPVFAPARRFIVAAALAALVAACTPSATVHTDYQPGTNFSAYKTFTMGEDKSDANPLAEQRVRHAIAAQLAAKGISQAQSGGDLAVHVHIRLRVDTKVDVWNTGGWGYGYGRWGGAGYGGNTYVDVRNVPKGTLVVDLVDRAKGEAVWRGVAQGTVDPDASPQQSEERINAAMEKLFKDFPPKS